ncbi:peptidase family M3 protein [Besnoitia besnoiti]|uniref:Peptidase family M3 protein n=1 Tax=Besnoitia besnoiti TaxID=94643 RepID=A0A2A9MFU8_BESBE|nr:peptidase family M3 protein [Besnoitia besnoiti]PFH35131.1 peptidase family M3 protein [Besnoitia besnoiti]
MMCCGVFKVARGNGCCLFCPGRLDIQSLPRFDLRRHFKYSSIFDALIDEDLAHLSKKAAVFNEKYKGKLRHKLLKAIQEYEHLDEQVDIISYYIHIIYSVNTTNEDIAKRQNQLKATMAAAIQPNFVFMELEIAELPEEVIEEQMRSSKGMLNFYSGYLSSVRRRSPHVLSEAVERALLVRAPWVGKSAVIDYYRKQIGGATFEMGGESMPLSEILSFVMNVKQERRHEAQRAVHSGLRKQMIDKFAALSLNVVAGSWHIEGKERQYSTLRAMRNVANNVSDKTVDALIHAGATVAVDLTRRYYKLKKEILKRKGVLQTFSFSDRLAPLPLKSNEHVFGWEESTRIVREGYQSFSPTMAKLFDTLLAEGRIDAPATAGKLTPRCYLGTPTTGPFILLEHTGQHHCVETLAHEAGHAIHSILSYRQGNLQLAPPLTIAEMASLMGERIVFDHILQKTADPEERLSHLLRHLDGWTSTVTRQLMFDHFEERVHTARAEGTVSDSAFTTMWTETLIKYYGKEGEVFDSYTHTDLDWARIPHFHTTPFYVYAYAFSELAVGSLYGVYKRSAEGFEEKYLEVLRAGNKKSFEEVMTPFGLNPSSETFWVDAMMATGGSVLDEAEALAAQLGLA